MSPVFHIAAFYKFVPIPLEEIAKRQSQLHEFLMSHDLRGLLLIAPEGINGTCAGSTAGIEALKKMLTETYGDITFKDSSAAAQPFKRLKVDVREEVVAIGNPSLVPEQADDHVSPAEWDRILENEDVIVLDVRNTYETEIGTFASAIDPQLSQFQEFPSYVAKSDLPKDKKVLMYCTGGIRCEKAALEMRRQGYQHVYQLDGGILGYLAARPQSKFVGECFVFDHRVSVNQELLPSERYALCPHCGDPGDVTIACSRCQTENKICGRCNRDENRRTCSKDCRHHVERQTQTKSQQRAAVS